MPGRGRSGNGRPPNGRDVPQAWLAGWFDPELSDLFHDQPELLETARLLRASRPDAEPDPRFRNRLRASLVAEAERTRARRRWFPGPAHFAWGGTLVGVAAIAATVFALFRAPANDHQTTVVALSNVGAQHAVSPDDVITIAFNQPMDQRSVQAGVHIQPATQVSYSWHGNNLSIAPVHHLAGNTPYTVTIDQQSVRASSGATAASPIQIAFGTASTPPAGPKTGSAPRLTPVRLGPAGPGAVLAFAPDGSVVVTSAVPPAGAAAAAGPSPSPLTSPQSSPTPGTTPSLLEYPTGGGSPVILGPAAAAAAFSPNGSLLATSVAGAQGGSDLTVSGADGHQPAILITSSTPIPALSWASNDTIVYVQGTSTVRSVDLSGVSRTVATVPVSTGSVTALAAGGRYAYVAPAQGTGGLLLDLGTGVSTPLSGSADDVAFSADGKTVAWVDRTQSSPKLRTEPTGSSTPLTVSTLYPSADLTQVALSADGGEIAYVAHRHPGSRQLVVAQLPSGAPLAIGAPVSDVVFAARGDRVGFITTEELGPTVETATVPGASAPNQTASGVPSAASTALHAFVDAQVRGDNSVLSDLSAADAGAVDRTPAGLSRAYIISAAANPDGTIAARVELIIDPTSKHDSPETADETLTLTQGSSGGSYIVTALHVSALRDQLAGPHIVNVSTTVSPDSLVVQIGFDSDLDTSTISKAIALLSSSGDALGATTVYDADSRTATVTYSGAVSGPVTVVIATSLRDVDGQQLPAMFKTRAGA